MSLNERVNLILELNISIPSRGKKDNKIYEVEFFLPVLLYFSYRSFTIDNNTFCERGCRDMNLRKANCNNDMGADKNVNIIYDIQE